MQYEFPLPPPDSSSTGVVGVVSTSSPLWRKVVGWYYCERVHRKVDRRVYKAGIAVEIGRLCALPLDTMSRPTFIILFSATRCLASDTSSRSSRSSSCWNSKRCQPDTSTFVHLYIDGFSCHYQLMPLAGMFIPIFLFHYHMILFSNSPLFSLPSFLHDSLTMWFRTFPVPLYLVIFVSCPSDVVPHSSATSEVSYFIYMMLRPISY